MPTSGTGISDGGAALRASAQRGFTLLELLVVVAIIGMLAGAVTLSLGTLGNDREIDEETERLRSMIDLLHEEALMQSRDYGVMFSQTGYRFYVFDYQQLTWVLPPAGPPARTARAPAAAVARRSRSTDATCRSHAISSRGTSRTPSRRSCCYRAAK